jgi:hypothetical protein
MIEHYPHWLPEPLEVMPWGSETYDLIYECFERDLKPNPPRYNGKFIFYSKNLIDGKEEGFWHITDRDVSRGKRGNRLPEPARCAKICWIAPMLRNSGHPDLLEWDYVEGDGGVNRYIWLFDYDYIIILQDLGRKYRLRTAYTVDNENERNKLQKKYERRIKEDPG